MCGHYLFFFIIIIICFLGVFWPQREVTWPETCAVLWNLVWPLQPTRCCPPGWRACPLGPRGPTWSWPTLWTTILGRCLELSLTRTWTPSRHLQSHTKHNILAAILSPKSSSKAQGAWGDPESAGFNDYLPKQLLVRSPGDIFNSSIYVRGESTCMYVDLSLSCMGKDGR